MLNQRKLTRLFRNPANHANDLIQDQLERMEVQFDSHCHSNVPGDALAIYQEYQEWIEAEEDSTYGFLLLDNIANY